MCQLFITGTLESDKVAKLELYIQTDYTNDWDRDQFVRL